MAVRRDSVLLDFDDLLTRLGSLEPRICRVEVPGVGSTSFGTGFLVGPDLVLTNHHVVAGAIPSLELGQKLPSPMRFLFGFRALADGRTVSPGTSYEAADRPLVDSSPNIDAASRAAGHEPTLDQLDYALLRLAAKAGDDSVEEGGPERGWVTMRSDTPLPAAGAVALIAQHPKAGPIKVALGSVLGSNSNGTRLRYDATTDAGSSGSPCMDAGVELVALHHASEPGDAASFNQGIPIALIARRLSHANVDLGQGA